MVWFFKNKYSSRDAMMKMVLELEMVSELEMVLQVEMVPWIGCGSQSGWLFNAEPSGFLSYEDTLLKLI